MKQLSIFDVFESPIEPAEKPINKVKNPDKKYLTQEHFDESKTNPNFVSYLLANGKQVGDEYRLYEAQLWITERVRLFKQMHGRSEWEMLSNIPEWPEKLKVFLREGSENV